MGPHRQTPHRTARPSHTAHARPRLPGCLSGARTRATGVRIYGPPPSVAPRAALAAFNAEGVHPSDLAAFVDQDGVAIRAGHHCTQPLHQELGISGGSARASLYVYSTKEDVDAFITSLEATLKMFEGLGE